MSTREIRTDRPILVFGSAGQVGRELVALAAARGVPALGVTRADADIADAPAIAALIARHSPRLVVNAAAYTAVDKAESEPEAAARGNVEGPRVLAAAAAVADVPILHLSTDCVFDGTKPGAYTEDDPIEPLGVYGRTKADGEAAVRDANPRRAILRTAWVYGRHGNNFLKTMMRLASERDRLRVVGDQNGCRTATIDISEAILAVDAAFTRDPDLAGTFHVAGTGSTSWHGFAEAIVAAHTGKPPPVDAIATADYPTPAARPVNSVLDSSASPPPSAIGRSHARNARWKLLWGSLTCPTEERLTRRKNAKLHRSEPTRSRDLDLFVSSPKWTCLRILWNTNEVTTMRNFLLRKAW